jgi:hypothetical protein
MVSEADKKQRIHNGESAFQATTADLPNIWAVTEARAAYANPYVMGEETDRQLPTYAALTETWMTPELRMRHRKLGDFWGPIVMHLRRFDAWMPIHEGFNTGVRHGYIPKTEEEAGPAWRRGECDTWEDNNKHFTALADETRATYRGDDYVAADELWKQVHSTGQETKITASFTSSDGKPAEDIDLEPGKEREELPGWMDDFEQQIAQNAEDISAKIARGDQTLQSELGKLVDRMRAIWSKATETQKAAWNERRRISFGTTLLNTRLLDVICSFESRWIPQEHCACPICWEAGKTMAFTGLPDFVNHMKNAHKIGWKNVKDFWCMTFSKILGHAVSREGVTKKGDHRIEIPNPYAWCPYPA